MRNLLIALLILVLLGIGLNAWTLKELTSLKERLETQGKQVADLSQQVKRLQSPRAGQRRSGEPSQPRTVSVSIDDDPVKGDRNAPVTLIEFSDYQCPFCRRFHSQTLPQIESEYIDEGKVRYVFRDYPLDFHNQAMPAAIAANCGGEQGKYWELNNFLFENPNSLNTESILRAAKDMELDYEKFKQCVNSRKYEAEINEDVEAGKNYGVRGTPSFFVGKTGEGKDMTGVYIRGARPFQVFKTEIDKLLNESEK